jgi:hypothetical protein
MSEETQEMPNEVIDEQVQVWNMQACTMVSVLFEELATLSPEEIYGIAGAKEGEAGNDPLLRVVSSVFEKFTQNGEGLPRVFFDSYERTASQFIQVIKLNIEAKNNANIEEVLCKAVGKDSTEMSYTDIAKSLVVEEPVPEAPEVAEPVPEAPEVEEPVPEAEAPQ